MTDVKANAELLLFVLENEMLAIDKNQQPLRIGRLFNVDGAICEVYRQLVPGAEWCNSRYYWIEFRTGQVGYQYAVMAPCGVAGVFGLPENPNAWKLQELLDELRKVIKAHEPVESV